MTVRHIFSKIIMGISAIVFTAGIAMAEGLVVYSPQGDERGKWITAQGKAAGHDIKLLNAGGGELFDRLIAEKNNPQADIVFGLNEPSMALLKKEGLFQAYTPAWADGLPDQFKDRDRMNWKFWQTPTVLAYNADKLPEAAAPKSWLDLTQPKYKGKYVIGSLGWSTTRGYLIGILARFVDAKGEVSAEGWEFMRKFFANAIVVNDQDAKVQAFKSGEAVIDLNWFGGAVKQASDLGYNVKFVNTEGGTPFTLEGVAIMKSTKQFDQAKAFIDWWGSADVQAAYAEKFGQAPAHPAALAKSPKAVQDNAKLVAPQKIDWDVIAPKTSGWLQKIELDIRG